MATVNFSYRGAWAINNQLHSQWLPSEEDDGGEAGRGVADLSIEKMNDYRMVLFLEQIRKGEQQFGIVPSTEDPNAVLRRASESLSLESGESPRQHPLLSKSQQFSGIDPKLTSIPADNSDAVKRYPQLRLQNKLQNRLQQQLGKQYAPTPTMV